MKGHQLPGAIADVDPRSRPAAMAALWLGALGVVYGDIGTSPLYALQTVFTVDHHAVHPNPDSVFSVTRQAVQLGFLPRLTVRHTSGHVEGQVPARAAQRRQAHRGRRRPARGLLLHLRA